MPAVKAHIFLISSILLISIGPFSQAKPIKINSTSDLNFGTAAQGATSKTVPAGTSETAENASFAVSGDNSVSYTITLPSSISMRTSGANNPTRNITVSSFTSYPVGTGLLDGSGSQNLYVGATRAAILSNQVTGSYSGSFSITVVY